MGQVRTAAEVRRSFLEFFRSRGHEIVPSSPVVLPADPTLLFANAGMNQFKEIFLGARASRYRRVANTQKCIRVSGKHNDLEEVGLDTYHHTFFEMLGNWSFGDYYKREAIAWAWELLTGVWGLPKERLWATIYTDDDEADGLWRTITDIRPDHILRFGQKDNFWEMGETGPCGPCSEIHIDRTARGCRPEQVNAGSPDVMEIWNLVFIQYNRRSDGTLEELPAKHVDTGMGLERITSVLQGTASNYDTDLFTPILRRVEQVSGRRYEGEAAVAMRVIADHLRTLSFAIADGVLPSNEGRGYVLRRLLRRAVRYGRTIGLAKPFLAGLLPEVEAILGDAFPELPARREEIGRALQAEEEGFAATLDRGLDQFEEVVVALLAAQAKVLPGDEAFKLYDTYGFPLDLTVLMAHEKGLTVDEARFQELMEEQRRRARDARKTAADGGADLTADLVSRGIRTEFTGYEEFTGSTEVLAAVTTDGGRSALAEALQEGQEGALVLARSPFYAEKGGQVGDQGQITGPSGHFEVRDTQQPAEGLVLHLGTMRKGSLRRGGSVTAAVDSARREAVARHHTATHLLQNALREIVSPNIKQAGSLVTPDRLRYDFAYFEALTPEQVAAVERRVNERILADDLVAIGEMALKDVPGSGIIALFDEKYGDTVRVVSIGDYSRELCGGTHVASTGTIGLFRLLTEGSIASGVRRIEAAAGLAAYQIMCRERGLLNQLARRLSVAPEELPARLDGLQEQCREMERQVRQMENKAALGHVDALLAGRQEIKGVALVAGAAGEQSADALKGLADALRGKLPSGVIVLGASCEGKGMFLVSVSEDLVKKGLHAGKLVKAVAAVTGGSGGGQPALARAGAKDPAKIPEAVGQAGSILAGMT